MDLLHPFQQPELSLCTTAHLAGHQCAPWGSQSSYLARGRRISFLHDAGEAISDNVEEIATKLESSIQLVFVGKKLWQCGTPMCEKLVQLRVEAKKVIMWLTALSIVHKHENFQKLKRRLLRAASCVVGVERMQTAFDAAIDHVLSTATVLEDDVATKLDDASGMCILGQYFFLVS